MSSHTSTKIKNREKPNDVFYTPINLVNKHISMIDYIESDIWYDPFYGEGAYYNNFPTVNKIWTEISKGKDFFSFTEKCDIICSNPPYSILDDVLKKSVELNPKCISYLIAMHNLTPTRIEYMNNNGYYLNKLHMMKVRGWYGFSCIVVFQKNCNNCISSERTNYYLTQD
jgi:hypothetical protein